jgi:hypothetical protein
MAEGPPFVLSLGSPILDDFQGWGFLHVFEFVPQISVN